MKSPSKYLKKRVSIISFLLPELKTKFKEADFHTLRIEIKKINALFQLLNHTSTGFKRKKIFKPFKILFDQAGKVREIQLEESMLKKYRFQHSLREYMLDLKNLESAELDHFIKIVNRKFIQRLQNMHQKVDPFLGKVDSGKATKYLKKKGRTIRKILIQCEFRDKHLHALRKSLKLYKYTLMILDLDKDSKAFLKYDPLTVLLGKWHDREVVIRHLDKIMDAGHLSTEQENQFKKIESKISSEKELLFNKITMAIHNYKPL